ncbi:MAG: hypothetical protein ACYS5F_14680 [Planctomycetota bacterium]|jgi:hypothetical protein
MALNVIPSVKLSVDPDKNDSLRFAFMKLIMVPSNNMENVLDEIKDLLKNP